VNKDFKEELNNMIFGFGRATFSW